MVYLMSCDVDTGLLISTAAKMCYSNKTVEDIVSDFKELKKFTSTITTLPAKCQDIKTLPPSRALHPDVENFLKKLRDIGHMSPFEHINFNFIVTCSRACSHQLVRHRLASYCLAGDTEITSYSGGKFTLKQLYEYSQNYITKGKLKIINLRSSVDRVIKKSKIKQILKTGKKEVYRVVTRCGKSIKATLDHGFLTSSGWKPLRDIRVGDEVMMNGVDISENKDLLEELYIKKNMSKKQISELLSVKVCYIDTLTKKFSLVKEKSQYPNRKPGRGKKESITTEGRNSLRLSKLGCNNPMWKGDLITGRARSWQKFKNTTKTCQCCGKSDSRIEIHHIDRNIENHDDSNILLLCYKCHSSHHRRQLHYTTYKSPIISIEYVGQEETYDIEMLDEPHNFVAEGFVVHNSQRSQRYVLEDNMQHITPPSLVGNDKYNELMQTIQKVYKELSDTVHREDARYVLPNACQTQIFVTMNCRELFHFFSVRTCNRAQWEIRNMALEMLFLVRRYFPTIFDKCGPACIRGKCPEKKMSCGKWEEMRQFFSDERNLIKHLQNEKEK